jgi:hypothetical protein
MDNEPIQAEPETPDFRPPVTYEEAAAKGPAGRILWAMTQLGRGPSPTRVYQKANERLPQAERDTHEAFLLVANAMVGRKILLYDKARDRLQLNPEAPGMLWRLKCSACGRQGPAAKTQEQSIAFAIEAGYSSDGTNICPICQELRRKK